MIRKSIIHLIVLGSAFINLANAESINDMLKSAQKYEGFFDFYWETKTGKFYLEIDKWDTEFLYMNSLTAGIGFLFV